jgi:N-acetylneuraminate synthase
MGIVIPLVAASMGASIIEKHLTNDRNLRGPDHKVSLEPYEFKRLVRDIRVADQAIGKSKRFLLRGEVLNRELFGKSLIARRDIAPGDTIIREMIAVKGPGKGLSPMRMEEIIGTVARRHIPMETFFKESDLGATETEVDFSSAFRSDWGLIARFTDADTMLQYKPRVIEFHLAEKDFNLTHRLTGSYDCQLIVHGPEYMEDSLHDLCSSNEEVRRQSVAQTLKTIELTMELAPLFLGRPKMITHPGAMSLNQKLDPRVLQENLARSIREIKEFTGDQVEILLENLPPYPWYFGGQWKGNFFMAAEEITGFCDREDLGICFDLSHAALYCNAKEYLLQDYIGQIMPNTRHIHFADAYGLDGEGMQIGEGDIELAEIMPLFAGYSGTWVPEVWRGHLDGGQGFLTALKRLSKYNL